MIKEFKGRTAVLTGAGSGFGLECARIAVARGMHVVLVDVQQESLDKAEQELGAKAAEQGAKLLARRVDVSDASAMQALAGEVIETLGAPHFVFNNAGVGGGGLVWESRPEEWKWLLGINLMGVVHGIHYFTPAMLKAAGADPQWRGHIVNTASMAGLTAPPVMGIYNASKHAVVGLSETLYQDLKLTTGQIGASVLCPHLVATGIFDSDKLRPDELTREKQSDSRTMMNEMAKKGLGVARVTAAEVAQKVFEAVENNQFYIYSHPEAVKGVKQRMEDVTLMRNPSDPFADKPEIGEMFRQKLQARKAESQG